MYMQITNHIENYKFRVRVRVTILFGLSNLNQYKTFLDWVGTDLRKTNQNTFVFLQNVISNLNELNFVLFVLGRIINTPPQPMASFELSALI